MSQVDRSAHETKGHSKVMAAFGGTVYLPSKLRHFLESVDTGENYQKLEVDNGDLTLRIERNFVGQKLRTIWRVEPFLSAK